MPDIKTLASEIVLGTNANTVNRASYVRLVNISNTAHVLITQKYSNGTTQGTFTIGHSSSSFSVEYVMKEPDETLQANTADVILATSIGFY